MYVCMYAIFDCHAHLQRMTSQFPAKAVRRWASFTLATRLVPGCGLERPTVGLIVQLPRDSAAGDDQMRFQIA